MKAVNIIALVLVIVVFGVIGYYINEVNEAQWAYWSNNDYNYFSYPDYGAVTAEAALAMVPFTLFFIFAYIGNMFKVKTVTTKVFTIIGLSFTLLLVLIHLLVFAEPSSLSFDESGGFFIIYHIINLAFFIVLLVQSIRYENRNKKQAGPVDVIDTEIV